MTNYGVSVSLAGCNNIDIVRRIEEPFSILPICNILAIFQWIGF